MENPVPLSAFTIHLPLILPPFAYLYPSFTHYLPFIRSYFPFIRVNRNWTLSRVISPSIIFSL